MSKPTPGPWRYTPSFKSVPYKDTNEGEMVAYLIEGVNDRYIADVHIDSVKEFEHEGEANARLMAAAPDLLEAAQAIVAVSEVAAESSHPVWIALRAAIAKAEGEL